MAHDVYLSYDEKDLESALNVCETLEANGLKCWMKNRDVDSDSRISAFREKQDLDKSVINGGFMVCEPEVFDYIEGDKTAFEKGPMNALVKEHKLNAYTHTGFWHCMDTRRDKEELEALWESGAAPWKTWND